MKKLIILIKIIIFIILFYLIFIAPEAEAEKESKHFLMTTTAYSNDPRCIADKYRDGLTAMGTPVREGIVAINVDYIDGKWLIKSPLNLGDKIYIEGLGNYSVEDTGRFAERDYIQDIWTVDVYMEDYQKALEFGRQLKKVYLIEED